MAPLFEGGGLACRRGGRLVIEQVDFALEPGEALVLRGPNGSGKSSLLRLLAGLLVPAAGELRWNGAPLEDDPASHRARLHHVGHAHGLKTPLTARENLAFAASLGGGRAGVTEALRGLALDRLADAPVRLLSSGQRRRLALARLLALRRPLWLLDEPGVGLDRESRQRFEGMIDDHRDGGGIVVLATHGDITVTDPLVLELGP